ncbi:MAG: fibronectin type III-like domain-contianing protein, partial [Oscillospiraceae bacterium]|nr:fibronectin type III-like domain-contianing protein [Oscillospiraceae bacterium]
MNRQAQSPPPAQCAFETGAANRAKVKYPFGYGLGYTTFSISDVTVRVENDTPATAGDVVVSATVTNTGSRPGKEVVQVYYDAPNGLMIKPDRTLAAFAKTKELAPGGHETLTITFKVSDMASYDDTGKTGHRSAWVMEGGAYDIFVGNSVRAAAKAGAYTLGATTVTEQLTEQLALTESFKRLVNPNAGTFETIGPAAGPVVTHNISSTAKSIVGAVSTSDESLGISRGVNTGAGNAAYIQNAAAGDYAAYRLQVAEAGTYFVSFSYANTATVNDALDIYVDGVKQTDLSINLVSSGGTAYIVDSAAYTVSLPAGLCEFKLSTKAVCGHIYGMTLWPTSLENGVYDIPAAGSTRLYMFDYNAFNPNPTNPAHAKAAFEDIPSSNPKEKCLANFRPGSYVEHKLNVVQAGHYALVVSFATSAAYNNAVLVYVDGVLTATNPAQINFPNTAVSGNQYYHFVESSAYTVYLPAGTHQFRIQSNSNPAGNVWYYTLARADTTSTAARMQALAPAGASRAFTAAGAASADSVFFKHKDGDAYKLVDVYYGNCTMDAFVAQMSDAELAGLSGGKGGLLEGGTGNNRIGYLETYGVTALQVIDGPAGVHLSVNTTAWPVETLLACTWNTELLEQIGEAFGHEGLLNGADIILGPGMNIHRNPLCARNFEYYSEDPLLTGKIAAAYTRGVQSVGLGVAIKHYAGNNQQNYRVSYSEGGNSVASERAWREVYLKGFQIAVTESDPWTVMGAYNKVNGTLACERYDLIT